MTVTRLLLQSGIAFALFASPRLAAQPQVFAPLRDVRGQFLADAQRQLDSLGFRNLRVAHQWMPDMPDGVVLWQYPVPQPQAVALPRWRTTDEIVLIVVREFPVLPDLHDWRADHALTLVRSLGLTGVVDVGADAARSVVTSQSINPGPVPPGETVALSVGPIPIETAQVRDTLFRTDTLYVNEPPERAGVPLPVVALVALGAVGLGGLGGAAASGLRRRPRVPPVPEPRSPTPPARPEEARPGPRRLDLAAFEPVIIDEAVWVTHGTARAEGRAR